MFQLNYRDTKPIYEQVKDGILQMIYTQVLSPEEKLPSVREMASRLAINPNTISRAYKELEQEGILYTQSGIGTFVNREVELQDKMTENLYQQFDKVTKQLFLYSVTPDVISERVQKLAKGGLIDDTGK